MVEVALNENGEWRCWFCAEIAIGRFHVCQTPKEVPSRATEILNEMQDSGLLLRLLHALEAQSESLRTKNLMNCHFTAFALLRDLVDAGKQNGWTWCHGYVWNSETNNHISHSWLEFEGWSIDSSFIDRTICVIEDDLFRSLFKAENVRRRTPNDALAFFAQTPDDIDAWAKEQDVSFFLRMRMSKSSEIEQGVPAPATNPWWKRWTSWLFPTST